MDIDDSSDKARPLVQSGKDLEEKKFDLGDKSKIRPIPPVGAFCICFCLGTPLLIISYCCFLYAKVHARDMKPQFSSLTESWRKDMIMGVVNKAGLENTTFDGAAYYAEPWKGYFPGTKHDCFCNYTKSENKTVHKYRGRACLVSELEKNCSNIESVPAQDMKLWRGQTVYVIRARNTSYLDLYKSMMIDGECEKGFRHCGKPTKGVCFPENLTACPLSDITDKYKVGYKVVPFQNFTLYTNNNPAFSDPISEAVIDENHFCQIRASQGITPGRERYHPLHGRIEPCLDDPKASVQLLDHGEMGLFKENGVPYDRLLGYNVSNEFRYSLFGGRILEWDASCRDYVQPLSRLQSDFENLADRYSTLSTYYAISVICFPLSYIAMVAALGSSDSDNVKYFYAAIGLRIATYLLLLPFLIEAFGTTSSLAVDLNGAASHSCSSDVINAHLDKLDSKYLKSVYGYMKTGLISSMVGFLVEILALAWIMTHSPHEEKVVRMGPAQSFGTDHDNSDEIVSENRSDQKDKREARANRTRDLISNLTPSRKFKEEEEYAAGAKPPKTVGGILTKGGATGDDDEYNRRLKRKASIKKVTIKEPGSGGIKKSLNKSSFAEDNPL